MGTYDVTHLQILTCEVAVSTAGSLTTSLVKGRSIDHVNTNRNIDNFVIRCPHCTWCTQCSSSSAISVLISFIGRSNYWIFVRKSVSTSQDLQIFDLKLNKYEYFHPLQVVGRDSETQLQVGENLNYLTYLLKLHITVNKFAHRPSLSCHT